MTAVAQHVRAIGDAWRDDRVRQSGRMASSATDFLPAALEVIERPVSPTARATAWLLVLGLLVTLGWLAIGHVDIIASAPGRIVPTGSVKLVQSAGAGIVRAIHVHDGDQVRAGQVLVELDTTVSGADLEQANKALLAAELDLARNQAIAGALAGRPGTFIPPPGTPPTEAETQRRLIAAQLAQVTASTASLSAARASALSDADAASAQVDKLGETGPILDREIGALEKLEAKGYAPGLRLLEMKRQRRSEAGDQQIAAAQRAKGLSDARKLDGQIAAVRAEARRTALADMARAQGEVTQRREEVTKASRRAGLQALRAPVSGTVQQLALHTVGGVVEPARALMVIVPQGDSVEVEARLLNRDAGFVREGETAAVKIEAFPFTRYGSVPGHVVSISRDAVPDPRLGPTYAARIALDRAWLDVDGSRVALTPGLIATADIRTGRQTILSYLLSPLSTAVAQSGHER